MVKVNFWLTWVISFFYMIFKVSFIQIPMCWQESLVALVIEVNIVQETRIDKGRPVIRLDLRGWGSKHNKEQKRNGVRGVARSVSFRWAPASSTGVHLEALGGNMQLPPLAPRWAAWRGLIEARWGLIEADASRGWLPRRPRWGNCPFPQVGIES